MVHTQREKVGRRRKWMWEGRGGRVKKLPCGHSSFHPIWSHHLKRPEANPCGRQSVVWETIINTLEWYSLTFLLRIRKWPELNGQLSCLLCLDHWQLDFFYSAGIKHNHFWSEERLCCENREKSKSITHKWHASLQKITGWLVAFWPIPTPTDQYLSAYLIVFKLIAL